MSRKRKQKSPSGFFLQQLQLKFEIHCQKSDLKFGPEVKLFWGKLPIHKLRTRLSVHFTAKFFQEKYQFLEFYIGVT